MSVNAMEERYEHITLFGKPALFTTSRIERDTVPEGWYCYDLRGSDYDPGKPITVEDFVVVNHAATVVSPAPLKYADAGFRRINGKLIFLDEELSLDEFCEDHGIEHPKEKQKLDWRPASSEEAELFYSLPPERDEELGTIGHVRIDFGKSGNEFWSTWQQRGDKALNSHVFKTELDKTVNELRLSGPLKDMQSMRRYCEEHGGNISGDERPSFGYIAETENYRYCLRCIPAENDYNAYLTVYDLRAQQLDMEQDSQIAGPTLSGM